MMSIFYNPIHGKVRNFALGNLENFEDPII